MRLRKETGLVLLDGGWLTANDDPEATSVDTDSMKHTTFRSEI